MGLFDKIKEKVNEVHTCAFCGQETSGLFSSIKLKDGEHICMDCFPKETKLMKQKDVCMGFSVHGLDYEGMKAYFQYREKEQRRREEFIPEITWLEGNIIVDREHAYFMIKGYEEVFITQQVKLIQVSAVFEDGKFTIACLLQMHNWIYQLLPILFTLKTKSILTSNQWKEYYHCINDFQKGFCPDALFLEDDIRIIR